MGRANAVTEFVKRYDSKLYCESSGGKLCIYRKGQRIESYDMDGVKLVIVRPAPYLIFALTEDWTINTPPRDWGLLPIREKLVFGDLWNNRDVAQELLDAEEERKRSSDRAVDNHIESYLKDNRREFARATNDILTTSIRED